MTDRRRDDRRVQHATLVAMMICLGPQMAGTASADVYTRKSSTGVVEATNLPSGDGYALTIRSKGTLVHSPGFRLRASTFRAYDPWIQEAADRHGVSFALVRAVIQVESEFDAFAVSTAGAQGLMQLMPPTARRFGVNDPFDPRQNIEGGVRYLRVLLTMFQGDVTLAAAAYNAGEGAVSRYRGVPPYRETQGYVRKVNALLAQGDSSGAAPQTAAAAPAAAPVVTRAASFYTPGAPTASMSSSSRAGRNARIYYRWTDTSGRVHVSQTPPSGVTFTTVTSAD